MKFELNGYDVVFNRDKLMATVYKDEHKVMIVDFDENTSIYNIVGGVALMMAFDGLLSEEDIEDVMETCGIPMENAREELRLMRESKRRIHIAS